MNRPKPKRCPKCDRIVTTADGRPVRTSIGVAGRAYCLLCAGLAIQLTWPEQFDGDGA